MNLGTSFKLLVVFVMFDSSFPFSPNIIRFFAVTDKSLFIDKFQTNFVMCHILTTILCKFNIVRGNIFWEKNIKSKIEFSIKWFYNRIQKCSTKTMENSIQFYMKH